MHNFSSEIPSDFMANREPFLPQSDDGKSAWSIVSRQNEHIVMYMAQKPIRLKKTVSPIPLQMENL